MKLLIIEDNPGDYLLLQKKLKQLYVGIDISTQVPSVGEAVQLLSGSKLYDLIFLDLHLEDSSGLDTLRAIRKEAKETPVIVMSGLDDEMISIESLHLGAQDYLIKDEINDRSLRKAVSHSIERQNLKTSILRLTNRYHNILHASAELIWEFDPRQETLEFELINGEHNIYDLHAHHPFDFLKPWLSTQEHANHVNHFEMACSNSSLFLYRSEIDFIPNGKAKWIEMSCYIARDNEGRTIKVFGSFSDITQKKLALTEAMLANMNYQQLFSNNPIPSFVYDKDTLRIIDCNISAVDKYGYGKPELLNMILPELWPLEAQVHITRSFLSGRLQSITHNIAEHVSAGGVSLFVSIDISSLNFFQVNSGQLMATDISEKVRLEQEMARQKIDHQNSLARSVLKAQEDQREMISGELHDNVNQLLTAACLNLKMARSGSADQLFISKGLTAIESAISEIRTLSKELVTPVLKDIGLVEAIRELFNEMHVLQPVVFQFVPTDIGTISSELTLNIFRIVQEQVKNTIKYSKAANCYVSLTRTGERIVLEMTDDGVGMSQNKTLTGVGLKNIENRCKVFGGGLQIYSEPGHGFKLKATIPV